MYNVYFLHCNYVIIHQLGYNAIKPQVASRALFNQRLIEYCQVPAMLLGGVLIMI